MNSFRTGQNVFAMYPIALCRHTRSSAVLSFTVVKAYIQSFPISLIQKWLKKLSVGSLLYSLKFSVQGLYFFPAKKELSTLHFRSYLQRSWSESASNNFLHISSFDFYRLTSFPLPLIIFLSNPAVYISLNVLPDKMLKAKELLMTLQKPWKRSAIGWSSVSVHVSYSFFGWHFSDF